MSWLVLETSAGVEYDLLTNLINFDIVVMTAEEKRAVTLHNKGSDPMIDITLECIAHPTAQIGKADDTYLVTDVSEDKVHGYSHILNIPYMSAGEKKIIWLRWTVPDTAIPGYGQFAIKAIGGIEL